eukprot:403354809
MQTLQNHMTNGNLQQKQAQSKSMIGVIQITSSHDIEENYKKIQNYVSMCAQKGAQLVCLPENFACMALTSADSLAMSEPLTGPLMTKYCEIAKKNNVWLSLGGFQEKCDISENKRYNTHVIVNSQGQIVSTYRKLHLFDIDLSKVGGVYLKESDSVEKGRNLPEIVNAPFGKLGLSICYDLRFPEQYRYLFTQNAQILLIPASFTVKTGASHWEPMLRCRAIENQCYVIAAAQTGTHTDKRSTYGHSMVIDPWGDIIGQMSDKEGCFVCEIDLEYLDKVRGNMACITHMRGDVIYGGQANNTINHDDGLQDTDGHHIN